MEVNGKSFKLLNAGLWTKIARMLRELNKILVFILALLQTMAPLAHAHAGKNAAHQGLHIPGLESFHYGHDAPILVNVNNGKAPEGLLVMIEAGIKNPQTVISGNRDNDFAGLMGTRIPVNLLPENDQNYSPHPFRAFYSGFYFTPHSPRAPPVL